MSSTITASNVKQSLQSLANPPKAKLLQGFFKTGKGEYAEGDKFLGITVPEQRIVAKEYQNLELLEVAKLLSSPIHEHRFTALQILVIQYKKADQKTKKEIISFYMKNRRYINNWDLVDTSTPYILGDWILNHDRSFLYRFIKSKSVWDRRIAILSTYNSIKIGDFKDIIKIAEFLFHDQHDLIHKAVGWMLREMGKKSKPDLEKFLDENVTRMPRTMLRYSIEKFPEKIRKSYLQSH